MAFSDEQTKRFAANGLFPTFFYATASLALAQLWGVQMHASWWLHGFLGIQGLALPGLALFRAQLHWAPDHAATRTFRASDLAWYLLLLAAGILAGVLICAGSIMLLGMAAALSYLIPWSRIPVCRAKFLASALLALAGALGWVAVFGRPIHPLHYVAAAWLLLIPPACAQFLVLVSLERGYRIPMRLAVTGNRALPIMSGRTGSSARPHP